MGNEHDVSDLARGSAGATPDEALTWYTPVRFDPALLRRLLNQYDALDARLASLPHRFRRDAEDASRTATECAGQLHELRRQEALWVYPVIARGLANDAPTRRRLLNLRFVMNALARRVLRSIEEFACAARHSTDIAATVISMNCALTEYRQRNESELYTLYCLMDPHQSRVMPKTNGHSLE